MPDFDLCVVGAGTAGCSIAAYAAVLGWRVALFERGEMGGRGLWAEVPGGVLRAAGAAIATLRGAGQYGVDCRDWSLDWGRLRDRVDATLAEASADASEARFRGMGVEVVRAAAHFVGPDQLAAVGRTWRFRRCVLAAGSAPSLPPLPGLGDVAVLTPDELPHLKSPPGHLIVLGGGTEAVETAQAMRRLACLVTLIAPTTFLPGEDPELISVLRTGLRADGVVVLEGHGAVRVSRDTEGSASVLLADGQRLSGSHLLIALDRAPRLATLDLSVAGVAAVPDGILTRADLRSVSNRRVWAAGSIAAVQGVAAGPGRGGQHAVTVARSMIFRLPGGGDASPPARLVRTSPGLLQVGMTEESARTARHEARPFRVPIPGDGGYGLMKLVCDAHGRLLGAGVAGTDAEALSAPLARAVRRREALPSLAEAAPAAIAVLDPLRRAVAEFLAPKATGPMARALSALSRRLP